MEVLQKFEEHANLWRISWDLSTVEQTFMLRMHPRSCSSGNSPIAFPLLQYFSISQSQLCCQVLVARMSPDHVAKSPADGLNIHLRSVQEPT